MDIQAEKLNLIKWLAEVNEPSVIESFIELRNKQDLDWWDQISDEERDEIDAGLAEADRGETIPHEEFLKNFDKWRTK